MLPRLWGAHIRAWVPATHYCPSERISISRSSHQIPSNICQEPPGELLARHAQPGIRAWAVAVENLVAVREEAATLRIGSRDIVDMARTTPAGIELAWQLLFLAHPQWPFFIDWQESPHPSAAAPTGCSLAEFVVSTPEPAKYRALMQALRIDVEVEAGEMGFVATLQTPKGAVKLPSWH